MNMLLQIAVCSILDSSGTGVQAKTAKRWESTGRLVAGVSFDIAGIGYKDPKTGAIEGFEPSIARAVAEKVLGAPDRVDFVRVLDKDRISALENGLVDIVVSQLTITPEREKQVDFSVSYYVTREGLLVPTGSSIKNFEDLAGKRIAATAGSVSLKRMTASLPSLPGAKLVITDTSYETVEAVGQGEADAASNDLIDLSFLRSASDHPDQFRLIDIGARFEQKPFGIGVKKGDRALVDRLNKAIEDLKSNGDIERLLDEAIASVGSSTS